MIDLYAAGTSNGMRARIALEECGLKYNWHPIDLTKGEQSTPQYLALNPMGQIPVIVDNEGPGGHKITLSQSSAIMMYCAEKAGKFIPKDPAKRAAMLEAYMSASTDITPGFGSVNACVRAKEPHVAAGGYYVYKYVVEPDTVAAASCKSQQNSCLVNCRKSTSEAPQAQACQED